MYVFMHIAHFSLVSFVTHQMDSVHHSDLCVTESQDGWVYSLTQSLKQNLKEVKSTCVGNLKTRVEMVIVFSQVNM